jgi:hypothetical protein
MKNTHWHWHTDAEKEGGGGMDQAGLGSNGRDAGLQMRAGQARTYLFYAALSCFFILALPGHIAPDK